MEYKTMIGETLGYLKGSFRPESDAEFSRKVKKRAESMIGKEKSTAHYGVVEITPEHAVHKKNKKFNAVVGVAAAAAVVGGSVLGIGYLNDHGGLHEGGIETSTGTGYHEDTSTAYAADNVQGIKDIMNAAGDRFEFGDAVAEIENVDYDGQFIRVKYTVEYTGEDTDENTWRSLALNLNPDKYNIALINSHGSMRDLRRISDKKIEKIYFGDFVLDKEETVKLDLIANSPDLFGDDPEVIAGTYNITGVDKSKSCYSINDKITFNSDLYGETELYSVDISTYGINLRHSKNFVIDSDFSFVIRYWNRTRFELYNGNIADYSTSSSSENDYASTYLEIYTGDTIDVNDIVAVVINGTEIPVNIYEGMELDAADELLTSKNIVYEVAETANDVIPKGCIIHTEPEFGLLDEKPDNVILYVSTGTEYVDGIDIHDTIDFSDCTVNVSGIERYGNTVKLSLDAYAKENCDMNDVGFCVYEYHEVDEPENRVYKATFSDLSEADNGHLREEIIFFPDLPEGTERTYMIRKYHYASTDNDEFITFTVTGEKFDGIYSDDSEYVGKGIEGEKIRISSLRIDPLTISFRTDSFNFKPLADSFNLCPNFAVKLRKGETMTYDKGEMTDDNGNSICPLCGGIDDTSGEDIRYIFIATKPIFDVNEIESVNILGAEITINAE